jgi:hypothetical protein
MMLFFTGFGLAPQQALIYEVHEVPGHLSLDPARGPLCEAPEDHSDFPGSYLPVEGPDAIKQFGF